MAQSAGVGHVPQAHPLAPAAGRGTGHDALLDVHAERTITATSAWAPTRSGPFANLGCCGLSNPVVRMAVAIIKALAERT